jgi:hypothetical protein
MGLSPASYEGERLRIKETVMAHLSLQRSGSDIGGQEHVQWSRRLIPRASAVLLLPVVITILIIMPDRFSPDGD